MNPVGFVFGVHLHQPVGNFDHVFADHLRDVYRPLVERLAERRFFPFTLHISGPLLEWLEARDPAYLDLIGRLAADGHVELLLAGFYEPVLASLLPTDRVEQVAWMGEAIRRRFGVTATGLWLTERVWEPDLAAHLVDAGVRYVVLDDRHFLVTGVERDRLHAPFWTESGGKRVALFPIDERLRYLIPFRPPAEIGDYLRDLRAAGRPLAVFVDDGEKFGGWPGTKDWVYTRGWLAQFLDAVEGLVAAGDVRLTTPGAALATVRSGGLAYLPTASYREMEAWSLPPAAARRLAVLEQELGEARMAGPEGALVRGAHWRNFLVKYAEANRMHKKMLALSGLCRERGDPPAARRAIGRAQCNDAYWHGVFGGLYLPHLRNAIWHQLAVAERALRQGESIACEALDLDGDGYDELWIHSAKFSALVSPQRGGAIEMLTRFDNLVNLADVLTRRRESYHEPAKKTGHGNSDSKNAEGTPSIHDIEKAAQLNVLPPVDAEPRAILVDRMLSTTVSLGDYTKAQYKPLRSWATTSMTPRVSVERDVVTIALEGNDLTKRLTFDAAGCVDVAYSWNPAAFPNAVFAPELSLARETPLRLRPDGEVWRFKITTVARSERGFEETVQGISMTPRWPAQLGGGELEIAI